ncbi:MAG: prephenate dehydrogenase/arogenate dehydrogenase family protein [Cyanobacteria bacterium P01_H01_bin.74]
MQQTGVLQLTVIGLGLIGGSIAMAAKERYPDIHVHAIDPESANLQYALKHGFVDTVGLSIPKNLSSIQQAQTTTGTHLIVIACHLQDSYAVLETLADQLAETPDPTVIITDVGSCKQSIAALGKKRLPAQFVAGHPMAGKEFSGIAHATSLLFAGKSYIFCPHEQTPADVLDLLTQFIKGLGAVPRTLDAVRHDKYMAYVSHLPQLNAVLIAQLMHQNEPGHLVSYHGAGLDGQMRLAASPYAMWGDVFLENATHVHQMLDELQALIETLKLKIKEPDGLKQWFETANITHEAFQKGRLI